MSRKQERWIPALWWVVAALAVAPEPAGAVQMISWHQLPRNCSAGSPTSTRFYCGQHGIVEIKLAGAGTDSEPLPCLPIEGAVEEPPLYPSYGLGPSGPVAHKPAEPVGVPEPVGLESWAASVATPVGDSATTTGPCANGSCYTPLSQVGAHQPWVAVIDWNDEHGWSVGAMARQALDTPAVPLALFSLMGDPGLIPFSADGVSDVHVLAKVCALAEAVDSGLVERPLTVNLSFGRRFRQVLDGDRTTCTAKTLGCQIDALLRHLAAAEGGQLGSVIVAASGNHRVLQFPAALDFVAVAGGLDVTAFKKTGIPRATWETPWYDGQAMGLLPASGYCLQEVGQPAAALAPGSSYSSALFAGWLAALVDQQILTPPLATGQWSLKPSSYTLVQGDRTISPPNPGVTALLKPVFDSTKGTPCGGGAVSDGATPVVKLAGAGSGHLPLPQTSFIDMMGQLSAPTPNADPCIPCIAILSEPPSAFAPGRLAAVAAALNDLLIDFSVAGGAPFPPNLQLQEVYLRIGTHTTALELGSQLLAALQAGQVKKLQVAGVGLEATRSGTQLSLLFVLQEPGGPLFWTSIPVLLRNF